MAHTYGEETCEEYFTSPLTLKRLGGSRQTLLLYI